MASTVSRAALVPAVFALASLVCAACSTSTSPGRERPVVLSVSPDDGAVGVSLGTSVRLVFSEPVQEVKSGGASEALVIEQGGRPVPGRIELQGNTTLVFSPLGVFHPGVQTTISLQSGLADLGGHPVPPAGPWNFLPMGEVVPGAEIQPLADLVGILAHDSMQGRGSGTQWEVKTADFLSSFLAGAGLEPGVPGFQQPFSVPDPSAGETGTIQSQNVLAALPGEGSLSSEWVILGAHYDHLGVPSEGPGAGQIFNGADDNASGTAVLMEAARILRGYFQNPEIAGLPRRSILFLAFGAEEESLLGSEYYCENPTVPLNATSGMVNLDMVGRLRESQLSVAGLWTSDEWPETMMGENAGGLEITDWRSCQSCSDYACFRRAGTPAVWLYTGFHDQYHTPEDDPDLVNGAGMKQIADLVMGVVVQLALRSSPLPFGTVTP